MTEKRFERVYGDVEVVCIDHEKNEFIDDLDYDKFVDLLNELHEENQELKEIIGGYIDENEEIRKKVNVLHEENQHLRELLDIGKTNAKAIIDVLNEQEQYKILTNSLKEQNQKLKLRLKDLGVEYY